MKRAFQTRVSVMAIVAGAFLAPTASMAADGVAQAGVAVPAAEVNPPANSGTATARNASVGVGDIIVTAQRKNESLQRVPISVTPVTGADLASRKLNDLTQVTLAAPSFQTGQDNSFSIRGVGSLIYVANVDSSVGVSVDEVSLGVPLFMSNGILDDVSQIEVLTGPQGLLFGRNASAGLLNVVSNRPVIGKFEGSMSQEFDDRDTLPGSGWGSVTRGMVNVPVSSTMALRVNGLYSYQDPLVDHIGPEPKGMQDYQSRLGGKAKLLWKPDSKLTVYLIGDYSRERGIGGIFDRSYRSFGDGSLNQTQALADGIVPSSENFQFRSDAPSYRSVDTYGVSANLSYKMNDWLTINNIAAWRAFKLGLQLDTDFTSGDSIDTNYTRSRYNQYSDEFRLAFNPGDRLTGQVGFYYFQTKLDSDYKLYIDAYSPVPAGFDAILGQDGSYTQRNRSLAGFGQVQYKLFEGFQLLAGGRVTNDNNRIAEIQQVGNYVVPAAFGPTFANPAHFAVRHTDFSYKIGGQYNFTPSIMAYATFGKGYKGPSFNQSVTEAGKSPVIQPESAHSWEAGIKTTLFDRKLRLNVSLFDSKFKHFQVQSSDGIAATTQSVASVRSKGIELSASAKPFEGLTINESATLLDSKFTDYPGAPCYAGQTDHGCSAAVVGDSFNAGGLRTPLAAKFTSTTQAMYEFPVGRVAKAFVEANWYHRSPMNFTYNSNPGTRIGTTDTIGASIGLRPTPSTEFTIFCKNCTNRVVPSVLIADILETNFNANTIVNSYNYDSVRTIGVTGSVRF